MSKRLMGYITPNNTAVHEHADTGTSEVWLHKTCVVYVDRKKGYVRLNSGGWETVTTKRRMNEAAQAFGLPFKVYAKDFAWFVDAPGGERPFHDGMTLPLRVDA